jgi:hypothetical protein
VAKRSKKVSAKKRVVAKSKTKPSKKVKAPTKYVGIVIDSSGSMAPLASPTVKGVNETLDVLCADEKGGGNLKVWSATFSDSVHYTDAGVTPSAVVRLTDKTYSPHGMTALHDAIAQTIVKMEEAGKGDKNAVYLLTVLTDGAENASQEYSGTTGFTKLKELIARVQKTGNWTINYIGCDGIEAFALATGVPLGNTMLYVPTAAGIKLASTTRSSGTQSYMVAVNDAGARSVSNFVGAASATSGNAANGPVVSTSAGKKRKVT